MAQGIGSTFPILGTNQTFGGFYYAPIDYSGSASYVAGGDTIDPTSFGFNSYIWTLVGAVAQSGDYFVVPRALNSGFTQWQLVWFSSSTGAEVGADTDLSSEKVRLSAIGQ